MEVKTYTIDEIKNIVTPIAEKYQIAQVYLRFLCQRRF